PRAHAGTAGRAFECPHGAGGPRKPDLRRRKQPLEVPGRARVFEKPDRAQVNAFLRIRIAAPPPACQTGISHVSGLSWYPARCACDAAAYLSRAKTSGAFEGGQTAG